MEETSRQPQAASISRGPPVSSVNPLRGYARAARLVLFAYTFLLGVHGIGEAFALVGRDSLDAFFSAASSPMVGLLVGIFATSIVQSSSVTTSIIVAMVAAPDNPLPLSTAVPMVMGANFGTTVTNTVVSLAHLGRRTEFPRAFAVSTCDDFFNLCAVAVLLPLEVATGALAKLASACAELITAGSGLHYESPIRVSLDLGLSPIHWLLGRAPLGAPGRGVGLGALSLLLLVAALLLLVRELREGMQGKARALVGEALERQPLWALAGGFVATVLVQSSSITTSLLVPLAGAGALTLQRAFPIVLGANLGTTATALMAATATTGVNARAGITIALVHFAFNLVGIVLFYPLRQLRAIPLGGSAWLARVAEKSPRAAVAWVVALFYALPGLGALLTL